MLSAWIRQQHGKNAVGDLAADARTDPDWPSTDDLDELVTYLSEIGACDNAIGCLRDADGIYRSRVGA